MATTEQEASSKHDDFFDDGPAPTTAQENGHISPAPEQSPTDDAAPVVAAADETDGGAAQPSESAVPAEEPAPAEGSAAAPSEEPAMNGEAEHGEKETSDVGASAGGAGDAEQAGNEATEASKSEEPEPTPEAAPAEDAPTTQQQEDVPARTNDEVVTETQPEPDTPQLVVTETDSAPAVSRQSDYADDFSDSNDAGSARETPAGAESDKASTGKESKNSSKAPTPVPQAENADGHPSPSPSPSPGGQATEDSKKEEEKEEEEKAESTPEISAGGEEARSDSRAEAGQVIPVDPPRVEQTKPANTDGRSSSAGVDEQQEGDAYRGEDRTEMIAPEGSEDCRGQGQWKSAEQQAVASAMLASKSERELTEEAIKERDTIRTDFEGLKHQEDVNRHVIKDLQERLAVLARESEEKDKKIFRLENDLKETQARLRDTERRLLQAEASAEAGAPKSKTCVVM